MRLNLFLHKSDTHTVLRRVLSALGPTWLASPARRIAQSVCFVGFGVLLLYVCWPYGSRDYAAEMQTKELIDAEIFLALDLDLCSGVLAEENLISPFYAWRNNIALFQPSACSY